MAEYERSDLDGDAKRLLLLITKEHPYLAEVEIVLVNPLTEPDTAGYFHQVRRGKNFVPTVHIVEKDEAHLDQLMKTRRFSVQQVAALLGIKPSTITPNTLRLFIVAHEMGHAKDYIRNYATNPAYSPKEADEAWDLHYESNLSVLPIEGLDPSELHELVRKYEALDDLLSDYPSWLAILETLSITNLEDLIRAQEIAYRSSEYERYADEFATQTLLNNRDLLELTEFKQESQSV